MGGSFSIWKKVRKKRPGVHSKNNQSKSIGINFTKAKMIIIVIIELIQSGKRLALDH